LGIARNCRRITLLVSNISLKAPFPTPNSQLPSGDTERGQEGYTKTRKKGIVLSVIMANKKFTVLDLIDLDLKEHNSLNLRCTAGRAGLTNEILVPEVNRPGLVITGFFDGFAGERIQVFGRGEAAYLKKNQDEKTKGNIKTMFSHRIPCCIFTYKLEPEEFFIKEAEENECPILQTDINTTDFVSRLLRIFSNIFSPKKSVHAVLMEVYGLGILIMGESGIGKSEAALELIKAGHRLVSDDVVEIRCVNGNTLIGSGANKIIGHHIEIRGLGIINVTHLFGVGAIRDRKEIDLVITLEKWNPNKDYDRFGMDENTTEMLGVSIPQIEIAVKPGRNICTLIETATMNQRLKNMGYNTAKEFNHNILKWIESENAKSVYFGEHDII